MSSSPKSPKSSPNMDRLLIEFSGYGLMRIPTDPDPTDDPRGVSGYSFAFGDEPDLDRVIRLQPEWDEKTDGKSYIRTYAPQPMGVTVTKAESRRPGLDPVSIPELVGLPVNWEDGPKLENRNLILTLPGQEPISPFRMRIGYPDKQFIFRSSPVDPNKPVYQAPPDNLARMAAYGMYNEPDTIGRATGMWDAYARAVHRRTLLQTDLHKLKSQPDTPENQAKIAVIKGRLWQLQIGIDDPSNRRIRNCTMVERFNFMMKGGNDTKETFGPKILNGFLQTGSEADWNIAFWIGAWDPDTLSAYFQGTLEIPYLQGGIQPP